MKVTLNLFKGSWPVNCVNRPTASTDENISLEGEWIAGTTLEAPSFLCLLPSASIGYLDSTVIEATFPTGISPRMYNVESAAEKSGGLVIFSCSIDWLREFWAGYWDNSQNPNHALLITRTSTAKYSDGTIPDGEVLFSQEKSIHIDPKDICGSNTATLAFSGNLGDEIIHAVITAASWPDYNAGGIKVSGLDGSTLFHSNSIQAMDQIKPWATNVIECAKLMRALMSDSSKLQDRVMGVVIYPFAISPEEYSYNAAVPNLEAIKVPDASGSQETVLSYKDSSNQSISAKGYPMYCVASLIKEVWRSVFPEQKEFYLKQGYLSLAFWVPFVGLVDIQPVEVQGYEISLYYTITWATGEAVATIYNVTLGKVIWQGSAQVGLRLPKSYTDYQQIQEQLSYANLTAALSISASLGAAIVGAYSGNATAVAGGMMGAAKSASSWIQTMQTSKVSYSGSASPDGYGAYYGGLTPHVIAIQPMMAYSPKTVDGVAVSKIVTDKPTAAGFYKAEIPGNAFGGVKHTFPASAFRDVKAKLAEGFTIL